LNTTKSMKRAALKTQRMLYKCLYLINRTKSISS